MSSTEEDLSRSGEDVAVDDDSSCALDLVDQLDELKIDDVEDCDELEEGEDILSPEEEEIVKQFSPSPALVEVFDNDVKTALGNWGPPHLTVTEEDTRFISLSCEDNEYNEDAGDEV